MHNTIVGGIEGGATHSHAVLMDSTGKIISTAKSSGTNHHLLGMAECQKRIADLINEAKKSAGIDVDTPILALGLSLSGCETKETNEQLLQGLKKTYPNLSEKYAIGSDTEGSVAAVSNKGGVVCIAGTGSNTLLINPDGARVQCGGWGNLLGDEGSAWKISHRAIKYCFDDLDNFEQPPYPSTKVWSLVQSHFKIQKQADILEWFYGKFDKAHIAGLCKKLADLAKSGDALAQEIFREAGVHLARSISAVVSKASVELTKIPGGIRIVCVGSVWLSWDLLKPGFTEWLDKNTDVQELSLLRLQTEMGVGAALMASDQLDVTVHRDYTKNYTVVFHFRKGHCKCNLV